MASADSSREGGKLLFVFDFDDTLVEGWSDSWAMQVAPELNITNDTIGDLLKQHGGCWLTMMNAVFEMIHNKGHDQHELIEHMKKMAVKEGMERFLQRVQDDHADEVDIVILSDGNEVLVRAVLEGAGCIDAVKKIYANPAYFNDKGVMKMERYHPQQLTCQYCTHSLMCKGTVLSDTVLADRQLYRKVVYVGDGRNDYCPCMRLTSDDCIVAREGHWLAGELSSSTDLLPRMKITANFDELTIEQVLLRLYNLQFAKY